MSGHSPFFKVCDNEDGFRGLGLCSKNVHDAIAHVPDISGRIGSGGTDDGDIGVMPVC